MLRLRVFKVLLPFGFVAILGLIHTGPMPVVNSVKDEQGEEDDEEEVLQFKQQEGVTKNTVFGIGYTFAGTTYTDWITVYQFFNYIKEKLNNRPFTLLDKENQELFRQAVAYFERQSRIKAVILKMLASQPELASRYQAAQRTAEVLAKSDLLLSCIEVSKEELEELKEQLQKQQEISVVLTYAMVNTEDQANYILGFVDLGVNLSKTIKENFVEAASEYCKTKTLGGSYMASQNQLISVLGNEALTAVLSTNEGDCVKVYLPKYKKWYVCYLDKKEKKVYSDSEVSYLGTLQKNQDLVTSKIGDLTNGGQIEVLKPKFYEELDSSADMNAIVVKVGEEKITVADVKRVIELLKPNVDVDALLAQYKSDPEYRKQFCTQALNIAIRLVVSAIIAEENELHIKNSTLYQEYLKGKQEMEMERLLDLYAEKLTTRDQVMKEFEAGVQDPERRKYLTDTTKLKGFYLGLENKAILDKLKLILLDTQNKNNNQNLLQKMKQLISDYSIYQVADGESNQKFDDRKRKIELSFGELYALSGGSPDELKANSFYSSKVSDREVYHLVYLEDLYKEDVTISEWTEIQKRAVQKIKDQLMSEVQLEIIKV
jgi:hypothetical protein